MRHDSKPPAENKSPKPYRIYADLHGDPGNRMHHPVTEAMAPLEPLAPIGVETHYALSLPAWTPMCRAAAIMASEEIEVAAVVDYERHVIGLLSALDIVRWLAMQEGYVVVRHHH